MTAKENKAAGNPAESETPDPFNLEALRAQPINGAPVKKILTTVPVRKPRTDEFFRVHPDPAYVVDAYMLHYRSERKVGTTPYWVTTDMQGALADRLKPTRLFTCISRAGVTFLWPAVIPAEHEGGGGGGRLWHVSALDGAERAKTVWLTLQSDQALGAYVPWEAQGKLPDPVWEDKTLRELMEFGFKGFIIDSPDHPVIKEILGLI
jgi:hypothetical protein